MSAVVLQPRDVFCLLRMADAIDCAAETHAVLRCRCGAQRVPVIPDAAAPDFENEAQRSEVSHRLHGALKQLRSCPCMTYLWSEVKP